MPRNNGQLIPFFYKFKGIYFFSQKSVQNVCNLFCCFNEKRQTNFGDISEIGVFCSLQQLLKSCGGRGERGKDRREIVRNGRQFAFSSNPFSLVIHSPFHSFNLRLSIPFIYEGICLKPSQKNGVGERISEMCFVCFILWTKMPTNKLFVL